MGYIPGKGLGKNAQGRVSFCYSATPFTKCILICDFSLCPDFMDAFTGIINPIEAKVRKGKGAVGAYGNERTPQSIQDFPVVDSEEEEEKVN